MHIVVNTRLLIENKLEGMGWFTYQTLKFITTTNPDIKFTFLFDRPFSNDFIFAKNITGIKIGFPARHPVLYYLWFQFSVKKALKKLKPDLFLSPDGFLCIGARCKQLPVIHDINFFHHPNDSKWLTAKYYNYFFPKFAKEAARIATVSEYSKNDIAKNYKIDKNKIDVVYNGINNFFKPLTDEEKIETKRKFSNFEDYFVYVGSLHPRKNIFNLIKAFAIFKTKTDSKLKLVLAGPNYWGMEKINSLILELKISEEVVFTGRLPNNDLAKVLGGALCLTYIPYYEGFGIPLVEAMQCQMPIITSNVTSLPEVAGNAAILVNPYNVKEIADAMEIVAFDSAKTKQLIENGKQRKNEFSWEKSGELLMRSILKTIKNL